MTHACQQLTTRGIGQSNMAGGPSLLTLPRANAAVHGLWHASMAAAINARARPFAHNGKDLKVIEAGLRASRVHRVNNGVAHGRHCGLTLLRAEFSYNLKLLGNFRILQLGRKEVELEGSVAYLMHLDKWIRSQELVTPLGDECLQAEVRAHHCVPATDRQPHQLHRRTCIGLGPPEKGSPPPAGTGHAGAQREALIAATRAALPVEGHAVGRHAADVLK
mmetsp:Transcript_65145/g.190596  ORF Transcript_65145/g.190596 Transcript_65145/m.190596 type:complete len:220 (+) Transcript_65145:345-1004(+)